ncbi:MAG TPA: DUF899 domain-containing protein [Polyangiales bacterium]|jgi:predicted dithiol-disulfide oxidoreductase (DUF899 family)|nr:DUF899 domain-containing protein [Polyangiales bacterium]
MSNTPALPKIVSHDEWRKASDALLAKEKELTHARDALAAERRRLPMEHIEKKYVFEGPNGDVSLLDLFEGRPQLLLYHFMFAEGVNGWPNAGCPGCSMYMDSLGQFTLTHLAQRDVSFAVVSRGPLANLLAYKKRMSWNARWVSSARDSFNVDLGLTTDKGENHGISVFVRDGGEIYRTYFTSARGLEPAGTIWSLLDLTPFGRQETWEDSPKGRPQSAPYAWWRRHDEYTDAK